MHAVGRTEHPKSIRRLFAIARFQAEVRCLSTGLHRFDAVARIRSNNDLWTALVRYFRTRYVVFEFKNYREKIAQGQIHTTEKYLYPVALRGTRCHPLA